MWQWKTDEESRVIEKGRNVIEKQVRERERKGKIEVDIRRGR